VTPDPGLPRPLTGRGLPWTGIVLVAVSILLLAFYLADLGRPVFASLNLVIAATSLSFLFLYTPPARTTFSAFTTFNFFVVIAFCVMPAVELKGSVTYWRADPAVLDSYEAVYQLLLPCLAAYFAVYFLALRTRMRHPAGPAQPVSIPFLPLLLLSLAAGGLTLWDNGFDVLRTLVRGTTKGGDNMLEGPAALFFDHTIRPLPVICAIVFTCYNRPSLRDPRLLVLLLLAVVFVSPTATARFFALTLYLALAYALFPVVFSFRYLFSAALLLGVTVIFPILNRFRRFDPEKISLSIDLSYLTGGALDTFQSIARVVHYETITNGTQLLGVLLFFVPRSLWPDKPVGSGMFTSYEHDLSWRNIAVNYFAEGYINFGLAGAIAFACILGWISGRLDGNIYTDAKDRPLLYVFALLFVGQIFFVLRGDLMSGFAYSIALFAAVMLVVGVAKASSALGRPTR
jgi:oligosaccharide repeat unit polymerase